LTTATYYAGQGSGDCEKARLAIDVTISELGLSAPRAATPQTFCSSATISELQATGSNIKWYNATGVQLPANTPLINGALYYAAQSTSSCESSSRTSVQVIIENSAQQSVPEIKSPQQLCQPATIADIATNNAENVFWYNTQYGETPLSADAALASGIYYASFRNGSCQNSPRISVVIEITTVPPASPVIDPAQQYFCPGSTLADVSVPNSQIVWYASEESTTPLTPSTLLQAGTNTYYAAQVAGSCQSEARTPVSITVNTADLPAPEAPAFQVICGGGTISRLEATGSHVIWYEFATGGEALSPNTRLEHGKTYYAAQGFGTCESASRTEVKIATNPVSIIKEPASSFICSKDVSPQEEIEFSILAKDATRYQWYENGRIMAGQTSPTLKLSSQSALNKLYYVEVSNECGSLESPKVSVTASLDSLIVQKRNHTLAINNNPATNGGYTFVEYRWYKNGVEIQPRQSGGEDKGGYYYTGENAQLDMQGEYYAEMWDEDNNYYKTCPFTPVTKSAGSITVYPNPLVSSQVVYVDANLEESILEKATIEIYGSLGSYIGKVNAQRLTPVRLPEEKGVYILKFRTEEREENFKIIVK
jgi:hypothetical protein